MHRFSTRYPMRQLPKIEKLMERYSKLPLSRMGRVPPQMHALHTKLKMTRSLILAANPGLDDLVSLQLYHHKRNAGSYTKDLLASAPISDSRSMHLNSEILRARIACLGGMIDEINGDAEKDRATVHRTIEELSDLRGRIGIPISQPAKRYLFPALHIAGWCAFGAAISGLQNIGSTLILMATGALAGLAFKFSLLRKAKRQAIMSGDYVFMQEYEQDLKRLQAGFDKRYPGFSEVLGKCRRGLEELLDNLLSQVPDEQRKVAERDISFIDRHNL